MCISKYSIRIFETWVFTSKWLGSAWSSLVLILNDQQNNFQTQGVPVNGVLACALWLQQHSEFLKVTFLGHPVFPKISIVFLRNGCVLPNISFLFLRQGCGFPNISFVFLLKIIWSIKWSGLLGTGKKRPEKGFLGADWSLCDGPCNWPMLLVSLPCSPSLFQTHTIKVC